MIELRRISKQFGQGTSVVCALDSISLYVPEGSIYGVIGSSGAGKSTLIRCVNLLERPTSGRVIVAGKDLTAMSESDLRRARREIGMIFQHFNLLSSRTVFGNIALPLELAGMSAAEIEKTVRPLLELTGLSDKRNSYPSQLSGGQKQRVAIARALASRPRVLLCDEASSALDPATTVAILNLLKDINRTLGLTILMITHEMDVVKSICDQVAILSQGQLIEENEVEEFFLNPRTELAREFVRTAIHEKRPNDLGSGFHSEPAPGARPVIRIAFVGRSVGQPLITKVSRQFGVDFSIMQADIETVHDKSMGFLMVELFGKETAIDEAVEYLREQDVSVEVVGYVR